MPLNITATIDTLGAIQTQYASLAFNALALGLFILAAAFVFSIIAGTTCAGPWR